MFCLEEQNDKLRENLEGQKNLRKEVTELRLKLQEKDTINRVRNLEYLLCLLSLKNSISFLFVIVYNSWK